MKHMPSRHERLDDQHTEERPQTGVVFAFVFTNFAFAFVSYFFSPLLLLDRIVLYQSTATMYACSQRQLCSNCTRISQVLPRMSTKTTEIRPF
jgi:hypothetical protein